MTEQIDLDAIELRAMRFQKLNPLHECFDSTTVLALIAELRQERERADEAETEPVAPPAYLALDLWQALNLPVSEFDAYFERNRWADTWANLLGEVRKTFRGETCGWVENGEPCVISIAGHIGPHMGASDVGSSEPLPLTPDGQEKNRG